MMKDKNIIVVKYGGSLMDSKSAEEIILRNIKRFSKKNPVIVVHGGGKEITDALKKAGIETKFVNGLRYTDKQSMKVVEKILERIRDAIRKRLKNADTVKNVIIGKRIEVLGYVGRFVSTKISEIEKIIVKRKIAIISPVGKTAAGQVLNLNADEVASGIAALIKARKLIFFTDVKGALDGNEKTIPIIKIADIKNLIGEKVITGGMIPKIVSCARAVQKGVGEVDILDINLRGTKIIK